MSRARFPAIDDRLVEPESGFEMIDGELMRALPANPPHADRQSSVIRVLGQHMAPGYVLADDLLTRVSEDSDFATDAGIRKDGIDPSTGTRYLEELSFEVKSTQSVAHLTRRARKLIRRGVRRIFGIFVEQGVVKEWSPRDERWVELGADEVITDPCLARPVKVKALLSTAEAYREIGQATVDLRHPAVVEHEEKLRQEELVEREKLTRKHLTVLCNALNIEITPERRAEMESMDSEALERLLEMIGEQRCWPEEMK